MSDVFQKKQKKSGNVPENVWKLAGKNPEVFGKSSSFLCKSLTFPHNLSDSQLLHFSGSAGKTNLNGPLLLVVAIGRDTTFVAFEILFSISMGENRSKLDDATSSLLIDNPPIPNPESMIIVTSVNFYAA